METVAIILPSYNEASEIKQRVETLLDYLKGINNYSFTVAVVNDGSKDNTSEIVNSMEGVHLVEYTPNHGKGYAVRKGLEAYLDHDYIVFMDVDLSTDLSALEPLLENLNDNDIVIGSRYDKGSKIVIKQPFIRRLVSRISHVIIKMMFHFGVKDTQCGFKGYKSEVAKLIVEKSKMDGFSFDVEHLYIAKLRGYKYKSLPVIWKDDRDSKVKALSSSIKFFKDLFKIKRNKKWYKK